jgi:dipeptidyl aminopeptidase/acylaminoacyl peptidase
MSLRLFGSLLLVLLIAFDAHARALKPIDVFGYEWADQPQFAPDGRSMVFVRQSLDIQTDRKRAELWSYRIKDGALRPLVTEGNPSSAVFAPDGKSLAYLQNSKLMLRWLDSGLSHVVTQVPQSVQRFAFAPDGRSIAFAQFVSSAANTGAKLPEKPRNASWAEPAQVIDRLVHRADGAGNIEVGFSHIFVVPIEGGSARQVSRGDFNHASFAWRSDSKALFVTSNRRDDAAYQPLDTDLYELDLRGNYRKLSSNVGPDAVADASANGRYLAYLSFNDQRQFHQSTQLKLLDLRSGEHRLLSGGLDRSIDEAVFAKDSRSVYVRYDDRGISKIAQFDLSGTFDVRVSGVDGADIGRPYGSGGWAVDDKGRIVFSRSKANGLADLHIFERGEVSSLTDLNRDMAEQIEFGRVEEINAASSADNLPVQGWIIYPPGFDAKKQYPMLLEIHGGPVSNYGPRPSLELQLYAAAGYIVLYANPRGSDSYGEKFANSIHHDYPNKDYDDLMSLVDALLAKGNVDSNRLYVTGGSGGGVLTAWIVGHTERFKAAVVAKPVINWMSFVLTSDNPGFFHQYWFPGFPWDHPEHYLKRSPLMYVGKVTTPTMVLVGDADLRTPVSEAEQYYHALKLRKIPTQLVLIPGASHSISARPSQMLAQVLNTLAWFEKYP